MSYGGCLSFVSQLKVWPTQHACNSWEERVEWSVVSKQCRGGLMTVHCL